MNNMRLKLFILGAFIMSATAWGGVALAVDSTSIFIDVAPSNPAPYENVTITLSSFLSNLDTVKIDWLVDGKTTLSGIGKKSFSVTAKAANTETKIEARIYLPDGQIEKRVAIRPAIMTLLWQATDSYVPPFYKGKALPMSWSGIKIVAMPEIKAGNAIVNPKNMIYTWKKNYTNQAADSGYGKNSFTYVDDYLEDTSAVSVVASTTDQKYSTEGSVGVSVFTPKILFYKIDSALGVLWDGALPDNYAILEEATILAAPYFISPRDIRRPELTFGWFINNQSAGSADYRKNVIPLKVAENSSGVSRLSLTIDNREQIVRPITKEMLIQF